MRMPRGAPLLGRDAGTLSSRDETTTPYKHLGDESSVNKLSQPGRRWLAVLRSGFEREGPGGEGGPDEGGHRREDPVHWRDAVRTSPPLAIRPAGEPPKAVVAGPTHGLARAAGMNGACGLRPARNGTPSSQPPLRSKLRNESVDELERLAPSLDEAANSQALATRCRRDTLRFKASSLTLLFRWKIGELGF
ncbi:hypothetical protein MRX96_026962 [Rhipicephalus microplus]